MSGEMTVLRNLLWRQYKNLYHPANTSTILLLQLLLLLLLLYTIMHIFEVMGNLRLSLGSFPYHIGEILLKKWQY